MNIPIISSIMSDFSEARQPKAPRDFSDFAGNLPYVRLDEVEKGIARLTQLAMADEVHTEVPMGHNYNSSYALPMQHVGESAVSAETAIDGIPIQTTDELEAEHRALLIDEGGKMSLDDYGDAEHERWVRILSQKANDSANSMEDESARILEVTQRR